jgi:hypothetical protein
VQEAARACGRAIEVREMPSSTRTAEEAAVACGVTVGQIVKSLVFLGAETGRGYFLLVSGAMLERIERIEQPREGFLIRFLRGRKAGAVDTVVDAR